MIHKDIAQFKNEGKCAIMRDLNGHTNICPDYNEFDTQTHLPLPDTYIPDISIPRRNNDTRLPDDTGKEILEFCKSTGPRIINGRTNWRYKW